MTQPELGAVVIGRNEGPRLLECLASIAPDVKNVIYVDSGSTDGSPAAAERLGVSVVKLDLARPFTAARARNEGFAALKARNPNIKYIQFVDGDCEVVHGWLEAAVAFIEQRPDVAVVCGRRRERHPGTSLYNRLCDLEWNTPIGEALACGGDSLVRVEAFDAVRGFRAQLIAYEEPEFCMRLREKGWKIYRINADMTFHDAAITRFSQWWTRTVRSGYGDAQVSTLHGRARSSIVRAAVWGVLIPLLVIFGAVFHHPLVLLVALIYPIQICRIAIRRGVTDLGAWAYAVFVTIAKFAEAEGIAKFFWRKWRGQKNEIIEYKQIMR